MMFLLMIFKLLNCKFKVKFTNVRIIMGGGAAAGGGGGE